MEDSRASALGERLKRLRQARGMTANELARRAGISASYYRLLQAGTRGSPSVATLRNLAEVLGVSLDELLGGEIDRLEDRARRAYAIDVLERTRDALVREPVEIGSTVLVADRGPVPVDWTVWERGGDVLHAAPAHGLAGRRPETCFVVTVREQELPSHGLIAGTWVLFYTPEDGDVPEDEAVVLARVYGQVRLGVYRERGQRVLLAGDGPEGEVWPEDGYQILGHYLGHWSFNSG